MSGATPLRPRQRRRSKAAGGKIIDNLLVPQNTRDFTAYLLKIQQAKPDVVATAIGGDDIKALREQVAQLKLDGKPAWINNQQDWPDVWGAPDSLFGVFGTTWYHKLPLPGVADFVKKWQAANKDGPIPVPGNVSYNGYMATRELLRAIERAGSTNNVKIIKELENLKLSATERMQHFDAYMDPVTHQTAADDLSGAAQCQADRQYRSATSSSAGPSPNPQPTTRRPAKCKLVPYEQVPTVDS